MSSIASRFDTAAKTEAAVATPARYGRPLRWILAALLLIAALFGDAAPALAQGAGFQRSYIDPFPKGDRYRVVVLGDSLGDGLWSGLYRNFQPDQNMEVVRKSKVSTGLVRTDRYDWNGVLPEILDGEGKFQIAVVMFGANDAQAIREGGQWYQPGTDGWRKVYGERVEKFLRTLRSEGIATYWVGLPVMRTEKQNSSAEAMNDIFREKAFVYGSKYIETWSGFTDEAGRYSAYGPDMTGQMRRLRADDGVHFTMRGYVKLAHFVEKEIRRDLNLAKLERNIPLAGDETEQARVMGRKIPKGKAPGPDIGGHAISGEAIGTQAESAAADAAAVAEDAPQIEESMVGGVALLRPAISDTTLDATQTLAPQGAAAAMPDGENIAAELGNGLTALSSISAVSNVSVVSSKPRLPLAERPYYRVLVMGEQLDPKAGRADDFRWPQR